jgi:hypothetical protein
LQGTYTPPLDNAHVPQLILRVQVPVEILAPWCA